MARICNPKYAKIHYDKRISIEAESRVSDGAGGFTKSWAVTHSAWAYIAPVSGQERWRAQQMETPITHKIIMNYQSGITTAHRIVYDSRVFNISEVLNIEENNIMLEIMAIENTAT